MKANFSALFQDPAPDFVFEVSEAGVAMARTRNLTGILFEALPAGTLSASPLRDNVHNPEVLAAAVATLAPAAGSKGRTAALILPDYSARISVLDFDSFPEKAEEQEALVRFRVKKSVPFDVESAALSYWRQNSPGGKSHEVVIALSPIEIIARYEAPFRALGMQPGLVTVSALAALDLVVLDGISVIAKVNGHVLTVMVAQHGVLKLTRSLELTEFSLEEIAADLFPTFVYVEDNFQTPAARLVLCGFAELEQAAIAQFQSELNIAVEPMRSRLGAVNAHNAGLFGYLQSTVAKAVAA